jgi:hypothetical protein
MPASLSPHLHPITAPKQRQRPLDCLFACSKVFGDASLPEVNIIQLFLILLFNDGFLSRNKGVG